MLTPSLSPPLTREQRPEPGVAHIARPGDALGAQHALLGAAELGDRGLAALVAFVDAEFDAADADREGMVDHQLLEPPVQAGAARVGMDIGVADLDRLRRHVGTQPGGHADEPLAVEDRVGHAELAADQRIEALIEMLRIETRRIDRPDVGVGGAGGSERFAVGLGQLDEPEVAVGEFGVKTIKHRQALRRLRAASP